MNEINEIFKHAMCLFLPAPTHKNEVPVMGIGFSSRDLPVKATKLLKSLNAMFSLNLEIVGIRLKLTALTSESNEIVFDTSLNFDENELQKFREVVPNGSSGAFVLGVFVNCQFYIISKENDFEPFNAKKMLFIL